MSHMSQFATPHRPLDHTFNLRIPRWNRDVGQKIGVASIALCKCHRARPIGFSHATATCGSSLRFATVSLSFTLTIFETPGSDMVTP